MKRFLFFIGTVLLSNTIFAPLVTIDQPGIFTLYDDIEYTPVADNDTIIQINSSNAILNLNGHIIKQNPSAPFSGIDGITLSAGVISSIVKNGFIQNITGTGIVVQQGCINCTLDGVVTNSCDGRGISIIGGDLAFTKVIAPMITNCAVVNSCRGVNGDYPIFIQNCLQLRLSRCLISNNGISTHNISGLRFDGLTQCRIDSVEINASTGNTTVRGIDLSNAQTTNFINCSITNHVSSASTATIVGIELQNSNAPSTNNVFERCLIISNTASGANSEFMGIEILQDSNFNIFRECLINSNSCTATCIPVALSQNSGNLFLRIVIENNSSTGGEVRGLYLTDCTFTKFTESLVSDHMGTIAHGCLISSCTNCGFVNVTFASQAGTIQATGFEALNCSLLTVKDCLAAQNKGPSDATSFGFSITNDTNSVFVQNVAMGNGLTAGNQFFGFNANNVANVAGTDTNTTTAPFTNFGITG